MLDHSQFKYQLKRAEPEKSPEPTHSPDESRKLKKPRSGRGDEAEPTRASSEESPAVYSPAFNFPESQTDIGTKPYLVGYPQETSPSPEVHFQSFGDEFDKLLEISKKMEDLPFDDDDDQYDAPPPDEDGLEYDSDDSCRSEGERDRKIKAKNKKRKMEAMLNGEEIPTKGSFNQSSFSCMTGGNGGTVKNNPNRRTIEIFEQMAAYYTRTNFFDDNWRVLAYRRAASQLKKQTRKISTYDEAFAIRYIGPRLAVKIEEIARTNRLRRLDNALEEPNDRVLQLFGDIYGVGPSQAHKWVNAGYRTLDDLCKRANLTPSQRIGVDHYNDFNTRIPRDEVTALGQIVKDAAASIDPTISIIVSGSYRRGASSSGDIDCMITRADTTSSNQLLRFLHKLVAQLTASSFLVAALAVPSHHKDSGSKWHGACVLPSSVEKIWRRIDFLLVPASEFGAALIYFTGDDIFNRSLRLLAGKKGMRLNQRGLYKDVMRGEGRVKVTEGTLVEGADEKRIFEILGVPWRPPHDRICH